MFFFLLAGSFLFAPARVWGADWKFFGQTPKASYYYDAEDMVRQGNVVRVWMKAAYSPEGRRMEEERVGRDIRNLTDSRSLEEINCLDKTHRSEALVVYSMEEKVVIPDFKERGLDFALPESIWKEIYRLVCE